MAERLSAAPSASGEFISWHEHLIDGLETSGVALAGSDGLSMADLDGDGHLDIVSVHESDTEYDGVADGHIRISFGSADPDIWESMTLAEGPDAGAAEDVAIGDVDGDGDLDVVAAVELAHLIFFENPGAGLRSATWRRHIPSITRGRGSFIRVFLADFDDDGRPEVVAANKGEQTGDAEKLNAISWFEVAGDPLQDASWREHELIRVVWPINAQPVDLDGDGDLDVVGGSVAESRIFWFENVTAESAASTSTSISESGSPIRFVEHEIKIDGTYEAPAARTQLQRSDEDPVADALAVGQGTDRAHGVTGFNMDFVDLDGDGRLDIVSNEFFQHLVWIEQPDSPEGRWRLHPIGTFSPDQLVGLAAADIDGDGDQDVMAGGYSRGPRDAEGDVTVDDALGRLAWFANPGDPTQAWAMHTFSRRKRGMFDKFVPIDLDGDGDVDFASTRGNSVPYDGVFWLEQVRTAQPQPSFQRARSQDSEELGLPEEHEAPAGHAP